MARGLAPASSVLAATLLMTACGLNMEKNYRKMRPKLLDQDFAAADEYIDSVKTDFYSKDNRLLYYMDKGMVLHLGKSYKKSNEFLEKAKSTADDLWTESVSQNVEAWLTTDNSLPYQGEDFEKVLIHFVAALNFLGMNEYSSARVEARQVTNKLELYNSKYEEGGNVYKDDAFARWLAGKLAETEGGQSALNDAWIDYRKAIQIYVADYANRYRTALPRIVVQDALRVLDGLGPDFKEEFDALRAEYPSVAFTPHAQAQQLGEVVLLHMSGEAPYKVDKFWTAHAGKNVLRIAYPKFVPKAHRIKEARVRVRGNGASTVSERTEDITAIAMQNLDDHMGRIKTKAIARQVSKFLAGKAAEAGGKALAKKGGKAGNVGAALQVAGAIWNVASAVTEEADKRSWITLPSEITIARVFSKPGQLTLDVEFLDRAGAVVETAELTVNVEAGKTTFVSHRTFR